jgi:hypothetical protein
VGDDVSSAAAGIVLGTVPVNLSNLLSFDINYDAIGAAQKRNGWISYGKDVVFFRATTASSLKRLTNTTGPKFPAQLY